MPDRDYTSYLSYKIVPFFNIMILYNIMLYALFKITNLNSDKNYQKSYK